MVTTEQKHLHKLAIAKMKQGHLISFVEIDAITNGKRVKVENNICECGGTKYYIILGPARPHRICSKCYGEQC